MSTAGSRRWRAIVGIAFSAGAIILALRGLNLAAVWRTVGEADYVWLAPALLGYLAAMMARAVRWSRTLGLVGGVDTRDLFRFVAIGYMLNNVLPARAGEFMRAHLLKRTYRISWASGLATIAVERVLDGVLLVALLIIAALSGSAAAGVPVSSAVWGGAIFGTALTVLILMVVFAGPGEQLIDRTSRLWLPARLQGIPRGAFVHFVAGLSSLRQPGRLAVVLGLTAVVWACEASVYGMVARGFRLDISPGSLLMAMAIMNLATALPSAPGYIGTFHLAGISALTIFGTSPELAAGYVSVLHAFVWLLGTALGFWYVSASRFSLREAGGLPASGAHR